MVENGSITREFYDRWKSMIHDAYASPIMARDEAIRGASLAAMQLMLAVQNSGYHSCPMIGFDAERLVKEFNIPSRYVPVMLIAIGKGLSPIEPLSAAKRRRLPLHDLIVPMRHRDLV